MQSKKLRTITSGTWKTKSKILGMHSMLSLFGKSHSKKEELIAMQPDVIAVREEFPAHYRQQTSSADSKTHMDVRSCNQQTNLEFFELFRIKC